jgi:hypothetical protein
MYRTNFVRRMNYLRFLNGFTVLGLLIITLTLTGCNVGEWLKEHPQAVKDAEAIAEAAGDAAEKAAESELEASK